MGNNVKGGGLQSCIPILAMMAMFILYEASAFPATTINNSSASQCSASGLEECTVDVDHANLVIFADPETSLKVPSGHRFSDISKLRKATPNGICSRPARPGQPYNSCVPDPNHPKKPENCKTIYNRACK